MDRTEMQRPPLVDIHCHLLPGIDDGAEDWDQALAMARLAVDDGIKTIIATPHQLGANRRNLGESIRNLTAQLQQQLDAHGLPLTVLPGADVRIEPGLVEGVQRGDVLSLGDHRRHVLLELPHDVYLPIEPLLAALKFAGMVGILSHPERNRGILARPELVAPLVEAGCLMQLTADSLTGAFGHTVQALSEKLLVEGSIHFVSTDAHGLASRRPVLSHAMRRVEQLAGRDMAVALCCRNPARVAAGETVRGGRRKPARRTPAHRSRWASLAAWMRHRAVHAES